MGKISLKEMNDRKIEKIESNDLKRANDMRDLELMAKYEQLSDFVLTKLHGNFECTIPRETFMEKAFNGDEVHGDDYHKDEELHIKLKIVPGSKLYRTELGPETEIAEITPPVYMRNQGLDCGRFPFAPEMMISHINNYEYDMAIEFSDKLDYLEKDSRDRWVQKNSDKFTSIKDAEEYYDNNWHLLTDVDYYKENLIRTSKGKIIHPDWTESKSSEIFYTKPRAVLTVNGKEVELLPEQLRGKVIVDAKNHEETVKRQLPTNKQADNLMNLVFRQAQQTIDRSALTNSDIIRQYQKEEKKIDDKWDIEDASDHKDFVDEEERNDENDFLQIEINNNNTLEQEEIRQENNDEYKRIHEQDDYDER